MKIWDQFKSKSITKQIFLMVSVIFIVFFIVYNSLMIYTKHDRYIEVPNLSGLNLDEAIEIASQNKLNVCICGSLYLAGEFLKKNQTIPN